MHTAWPIVFEQVPHELASLDFKFIIVIQGMNMEGALQKRSDVKVGGYVRRYIGTYTRIVYAGTWPGAAPTSAKRNGATTPATAQS